MVQKDVTISLILPVYNNKRRAQQSARRLQLFLGQHFDTFEIIIIDDGSQASERIMAHHLPVGVKIIHNAENRGKGFSVKRGMLVAQGQCRIFTDIDLPYDLNFITHAAKIILSNACHFVAGDRSHFESIEESRPRLSRRLASHLFRTILPRTVLGKSIDTQCGFKACSNTLVTYMFPLLTINRFAFDIELFFLLAKHDIMVIFLPVRLVNSQESSVHIVRDGVRIIIDAVSFAIRWQSARRPVQTTVPAGIPRGWEVDNAHQKTL